MRILASERNGTKVELIKETITCSDGPHVDGGFRVTQEDYYRVSTFHGDKEVSTRVFGKLEEATVYFRGRAFDDVQVEE